jgi:hypothetical protein
VRNTSGKQHWSDLCANKRHEPGSRKTGEWIGDSRAGGFRSTYHGGGGGVDGAGSSRATALNPRDPPAAMGWWGAAKRERIRSRARWRRREKTEKGLADEGGFV